MSATCQLQAETGAGKGGGREGVGPGDQGWSTEALGDPVAGLGFAVNTRSQGGTRQEPGLPLNAAGAPQGSAARIPWGAASQHSQGSSTDCPTAQPPSCPRQMLSAVSVSPGPDLEMESGSVLFPSWVFTIPS